MAITRTIIVDDDGTGTTGTVIDNAWKQEFYDQIDALVPGGIINPWTARPFNAAHYTVQQGTGTWTVTSANFSSAVLNANTGLIAWFVTGMSISGTPITLGITLPFGGSIAVNSVYGYSVGGQNGTGLSEVQQGATVLRLLRDIGGTTWPAGSGYIWGQLIIPTG